MPPATSRQQSKPLALLTHASRHVGPPNSHELRLIRRILSRAGYAPPSRPDPS